MSARVLAAFVVVFVAFGAFGILAADAANPGGFSPVVNPLSQLPAAGVLIGTSCPSSTECVSVGLDIGYDPLVLAGDPATWGPDQMKPIPVGSRSRLLSVSCASTTECVAVGYDGNGQPLTLIGDPATWGPDQAKEIAIGDAFGDYAVLTSITCQSSTDCVAVGYDANDQAIVLAGDPSTWGAAQAQEIALGSSFGSGGYFESVSCTSSSSCVAVGGDDIDNPLVLAGDPATWSAAQAQQFPLGSGFGSGGWLNSVACASSSSCVAVGGDENGQPLELAGDPSSWSLANVHEITLGHPFGIGGELLSVTCTSASSCVSVGYDGFGDPLIVQGDPATPWTAAQAQEFDLSLNGGTFGGGAELLSIACTSTSNCVAAGIDNDNQPLILSGNPGTWTANDLQEIAVYGARFGVESFPSSLSCTSNTSCIDISSYFSVGEGSYVLQGDPATWDQAEAVKMDGLNPYAFVEAGDCPSATYCVAVGWDDFNGGAMVVAGDPSTFDTATDATIAGAAYDLGADFSAIDCPSTTFCVAVGQDFNSQPVVLSGDPATWAAGGNTQEIALPHRLHSHGALESVSCTSETSCVAVGYDGNHQQPIVLSGDPASWTLANVRQITMNSMEGYTGVFTSVSCVSSTYCVGVGYSGGVKYKPLVVKGNPATWTALKAFNLGIAAKQSDSVNGYFENESSQGKGYVASVSCDANSTKYCVIVGGDKHGAPIYMSGNPANWKGHLMSRPAQVIPSFVTAELLTTSCTATKCFSGGDSTGGDVVASYSGG
ncbi:MAG: hypothetical protein QOG85_1804 [Gaiellaceae bacterium]|jgi:hypothetical protein|nr:hypothetical protein [Gaiellaceae bacterium]